MNEREEFFADQHKLHCDCEIRYEAVTFRFPFDGAQSNYTPDFYCPKSLTFYEVVGSRQAFEQNKPKINEFRIAYPQVKFEVVNPDETEYLQRTLGARNANIYVRSRVKERIKRKDFEFRKQIKERLIAASEQDFGLLTDIARSFDCAAAEVCQWKTTRLFNSKTARRVAEYLDSHPAMHRTIEDHILKLHVAKAAAEFCKRGHPFDEANTYRWRGTRACRTCARKRERRYYQSKKMREQITQEPVVAV